MKILKETKTIGSRAGATFKNTQVQKYKTTCKDLNKYQEKWSKFLEEEKNRNKFGIDNGRKNYPGHNSKPIRVGGNPRL